MGFGDALRVLAELGVADCVRVVDRVVEGEPVVDRVPVCVRVPVRVPERVCDDVRDGVGDPVGDREVDGVAAGLGGAGTRPLGTAGRSGGTTDCPLAFAPQHTTAPDERRAHEWWPPHVTATAPAPATAGGTSHSPSALRPKHVTPPARDRTHVCAEPAQTAATSCVAAGGSVRWPKLLSPQQ